MGNKAIEKKKIKYIKPNLIIITLNSYDVLTDSKGDNDDYPDDPYDVASNVFKNL